jgi:hypothetical protein
MDQPLKTLTFHQIHKCFASSYQIGVRQENKQNGCRMNIIDERHISRLVRDTLALILDQQVLEPCA